MFKNQEVLDVFFNHYIVSKENIQRLNGELEKGMFKLSIHSVKDDFSISASKARRLICRFVDNGIIEPIQVSKSRWQPSVYAYTTVYSECKKIYQKKLKRMLII